MQDCDRVDFELLAESFVLLFPIDLIPFVSGGDQHEFRAGPARQLRQSVLLSPGCYRRRR